MNSDSPFGINPVDLNRHDNALVETPELYLPISRSIQVLACSCDMLHDFYMPSLHARMNMVPGMITTFWLTPAKAGRYDILYA